MFKLLKSITHFPRISLSKACLIKADGLIEHGHYKDALIEATKARDAKGANGYEIEIAKGKMISILNILEPNESLYKSNKL